MTRGQDTSVTSTQLSTAPTPGIAVVLRVVVSVHSSQARRAGLRVSKTKWPPGRRASRTPVRVAAQSCGSTTACAAFPFIGGEVDPQRRERCRVAVQPADPRSAGLGAGHLQGACGWVYAGDVNAAVGEQEGEHAGAAADVQHSLCHELLRQCEVRVEVTAVGIQRVVDRDQARVLENRVGHEQSLQQAHSRRALGLPFASASQAGCPLTDRFPVSAGRDGVAP